MAATIQRGATGSWSGEITAGDTAVTYEVRPGDSLSIIARDILGDVSRWPEIAALNNIPEPYTIHVGDILELPAYRQPPVQLPTRASATKSPAPPPDNKQDWAKWIGWGAVVVGVGLMIFQPTKRAKRRRR